MRGSVPGGGVGLGGCFLSPPFLQGSVTGQGQGDLSWRVPAAQPRALRGSRAFWGGAVTAGAGAGDTHTPL